MVDNAKQPTLPSLPPSYSQISSRTQTISTIRPPRPPSYEEAELTQIAKNLSLEEAAAPPPSEISGEENVPEEEDILESNFWASNLGNSLPNRVGSSRSLLANIGVTAESDQSPEPPVRLWRETLVYSIYFLAVAILLILYTVYLVYINRPPKFFTLIFAILLYIGIGFLVWVCYLVLTSFLKRTMKKRKNQNK